MENLFNNSVYTKPIIEGSFYNNCSYEDFRYELDRAKRKYGVKSSIGDILGKIHASKFFNLPYIKIDDLSKYSLLSDSISIYYESFYCTKFCNIDNPKRVNTKYLGD